MNGVSGADTSGCVTITLDHTGRVDEIRLSTRWRDKLSDEQLGTALTEAIVLGQAERTAGSQEPAAHLDGPSETTLGSQEVAELCRTALVAAAHRMERDRNAIRVGYAGSDPRHHVQVTLTLDGTPTAVTFEPRWLESASTARLTETMQEALSAAFDAVDAARREVAGADLTAARQQLRRLAQSEGGTR